jgi:hypothetical protein
MLWELLLPASVSSSSASTYSLQLKAQQSELQDG